MQIFLSNIRKKSVIRTQINERGWLFFVPLYVKVLEGAFKKLFMFAKWKFLFYLKCNTNLKKILPMLAGNLWTTSTNLDLSEEVRLLRARIAQLEHPQTTNLPASSSVAFNLVAQNGNYPVMSIPHFDIPTYERVNLDALPSKMPNGLDLPLRDIDTLRFFFNVGVQHARAILQRGSISSLQTQPHQQQHQQQFAVLQQQNAAGQQAVDAQELANDIEQLRMQQKLLAGQQMMLKAQRDALATASQVEKTASAGATGGTQQPLQQTARLGPHESHSQQMSHLQISSNNMPSSSILSSPLSSKPSNLLSSSVIKTTTNRSSSVVQPPLTPPISLAEREGPLENGTQQTVEQSFNTEEMSALNNLAIMLKPPRSNRRCKIVANKNISKTLTNGRRSIVGKNGGGGGFPNANFDCTCKRARGINKFSVGCSQCKRSFHGKCVRVSRRESKRIPFWQCADCKMQQKEGDEGEILLMFCVCKKPYDNERFYVGCDGCGDWYHPECVETTEDKINALGEEPYSCPVCKRRPQQWFDAKMTKTELNH